MLCRKGLVPGSSSAGKSGEKPLTIGYQSRGFLRAGRSAFLLRKGEEGLSVFDLEAVQPPLTEAEVLQSFRSGSEAVVLSVAELEAKDLLVVAVPGMEPLPQRLREAHAEIRPGPAMTRAQFKQALKELE